MNEQMDKPEKDEWTLVLEQGRYARAVQMAGSRGLTEQEIADFKAKALWQIAAVARNAPGARRLAEEYGFSKNKVEKVLKSEMHAKQKQGDVKVLLACYDPLTQKYLTFEEWLVRLFQQG